MKELRDIIREYDRIDKTKTNLVLATVFDVKGSSYRRTGARMLIQDSGQWTGGISGGCIEGNALKRANMVMADGKARIITYDTENDDEASIGVSLGCNGVISVLFAPIEPDSSKNQIEKLRSIVGCRSPQLIVTVLKSTNNQFFDGQLLTLSELEDLATTGEGPEEILKTSRQQLELKKSAVHELNDGLFFFELVNPAIRLLVMGGNYDTYPLLNIASDLGWENIVITNPRRLYSKVKSLAIHIEENIEQTKTDDHTVAVIMSHDYHADLKNLRKALATELNYIGLLGPAVRRNDMIEELAREGIEVDRLRIFGPAGLDLGANQPEEIAIAIIAEIISVLRNRKAQSLRDRKSTIHER